MMVETEV